MTNKGLHQLSPVEESNELAVVNSQSITNFPMTITTPLEPSETTTSSNTVIQEESSETTATANAVIQNESSETLPAANPEIQNESSETTTATPAVRQEDHVTIPSPIPTSQVPMEVPVDSAPSAPFSMETTASLSSPPPVVEEKPPEPSNQDPLEEETITPMELFSPPVTSKPYNISFSIPTPEGFDPHDFAVDAGATPHSMNDDSPTTNQESLVEARNETNPIVSLVEQVTSVMVISQTETMHHDNCDDSGEEDKIPLVPQEPPSVSLSTETLPLNVLHTENNVSNEQDMAIMMQQLQQQFTDQLQRLEENYQVEQTARQEEYEKTLATLRHQLQQKEDQRAQEFQNREQRVEGSVKQVESLQRELRKVKELLGDKEKEDRRLQEAHLNQLRGMEKELFKKEDVINSLQKTIRELEVRFAAKVVIKVLLCCWNFVLCTLTIFW